MIANGISWSTFGILYGALAAAVILIYLLRMARRGRAVSSTLIWQKVMGSRRSLWKELISLVLQLLLILLLCLALVDPRPPADSFQRRWVVLIFDASESMAAHGDGPSRLRQAERDAWRMISTLRESDRAMIVSAAAEIDALTPFTGNQEELKQALTKLKPTGTRPKIAEAIDYALSSFAYAGVGENDTKHLYVLTDKPETVVAPEVENVQLGVIGVGQTLPNLALTSFDVRKTLNLTEAHDALLRVTNFAAEPVAAELAIFTPENTITINRVDLGPGETHNQVVGLPFNTFGKVTALLRKVQFADGAPDALASDNAAFAFVPPTRKSKVVLVTNKNLFLYNALALNPEIDMVSIRPEEYRHGLSSAADVVIFDRFTPPQEPVCSAMYFHPSPGGPFAVMNTKKKPAMTGWAEGHPLLRHVVMDTLQIDEARILKPAKDDVVLMGHFDGALMLLRPRGDTFLLGVGFDLAKTDLPLQSAFPIFIHNVVHIFSRKPEGEIDTGHRIGDRVDLTVTEGRERVVLVDPLENKIPVAVRGGRALYRPEMPGFYSYADAGALRVFAASLLDDKESDLTVTQAGALPAFDNEDGRGGIERIAPWLILAALLLAALDMVLFLNGKLS